MPTTLSSPYTTIEKVKRECQIKQSETTNDDWLRECVNDASRKTEEMCQRDFWYHDHSSTLLSCKTGWVVGPIIFLPWPVMTLTEIQIDDVAVESDTWAYENQDVSKGGAKIFRVGNVHWASFQYPTEGDGISDKYEENPNYARDRLRGFPKGPTHHDPTQTTIKLQGTFGYTLEDTDPTEKPPTDLPFGPVRIATLIASALSGMNRKQYTPLEGGAPVEYTEYRIPKEAKDIAKRYKRLVI